MRILLLADIHIGVIKDTNYVYEVMTEIIEKEIIFQKCDAVIILGDYFHRLFKVNEEYVSCAINIMSFLIRACKRNHTKIRMIYGTESHEMNQYKLFNYHITSSNIDIRIIDTVTEEELFPDIHVLYIPEEYMKDKKEFYKDTLYSNKHYEYIFGHGIIEDGMPSIISYNNHKSEEKQVPRFKSGELSEICDLSIWGHYHIRNEIVPNKVYYLGSLFRSSFGEEISKGYGIIEDDQFHFIENKRAYIYKSYEYLPGDPIYESPDIMIKELKRMKEENPGIFDGSTPGKIRMVFILPTNINPAFKDNLKDLMLQEKHITTLIKNNNDLILEEVKEEIEDEYDYLLDSKLSIEEKVYRFIHNTTGYSLPLEIIQNYIKEK